MDTKNDNKIVKCGIMAEKQDIKVVVGAKQIRKGLSAGRFSLVYLAGNADPAITQPLETLCIQSNVSFTWVPSMKDLGHACGIDVGAAAAAVIN